MTSNFKSAEIFEYMSKELNNNKALCEELIKKTKSKIVFDLKNKQNQHHLWQLNLKNSTDKLILHGEATNKEITKDADLIIKLNDLDFKKLYNGKLNSQKLFLSGKLKVKGDMMKAANVESILKAVNKPKAKL